MEKRQRLFCSLTRGPPSRLGLSVWLRCSHGIPPKAKREHRGLHKWQIEEWWGRRVGWGNIWDGMPPAAYLPSTSSGCRQCRIKGKDCRTPNAEALGADAAGTSSRPVRMLGKVGRHGDEWLSNVRSAARPRPKGGGPCSSGSTTGTSHADRRDVAIPWLARR
jgi:hypothetical protein